MLNYGSVIFKKWSMLKTMCYMLLVLNAAPKNDEISHKFKDVEYFYDIKNNDMFWKERYDFTNKVHTKISYFNDDKFNIVLDYRKSLFSKMKEYIGYNEAYDQNIFTVNIKLPNDYNAKKFKQFIQNADYKAIVKENKQKYYTKFVFEENDKDEKSIIHYIDKINDYVNKKCVITAPKNKKKSPNGVANAINDNMKYKHSGLRFASEQQIVAVNWIIQFFTEYKIVHLLVFPLISIDKNTEGVNINFTFDFNCAIANITKSLYDDLKLKVKSIYGKYEKSNIISYNSLCEIYTQIKCPNFTKGLKNNFGSKTIESSEWKILVDSYANVFWVLITLNSNFKFVPRNLLYFDESCIKSKEINFVKIKESVESIMKTNNFIFKNFKYEVDLDNFYTIPNEINIADLKKEISNEILNFYDYIAICEDLKNVIIAENKVYDDFIIFCQKFLILKTYNYTFVDSYSKKFVKMVNDKYSKPLEEDTNSKDLVNIATVKYSNPLKEDTNSFSIKKCYFSMVCKNSKENIIKFLTNYVEIMKTKAETTNHKFITSKLNTLKSQINTKEYNDIVKTLDEIKNLPILKTNEANFASIINSIITEFNGLELNFLFDDTYNQNTETNNSLTHDFNIQKDPTLKNNIINYIEDRKKICYVNNVFIFLINNAVRRLNEHGAVVDYFRTYLISKK